MSGGFLKQTQKQKLLQKLSPQQIQLMKLLQVPTASLEDRVREELEGNPALETGVQEPSEENGEDPLSEAAVEASEEKDEENDELDDYLEMDLSDYLQDEDHEPGAYYSKSSTDDEDDEPTGIPLKVENSFHDHLEGQLNMLALNEQEFKIALQIIGSIDKDGYLRREPISIVDDLAFKQSVTTNEEEVKHLIKKIQKFDPPGVSAQDLQECLAIQLNRISEKNAHQSIALKIIKNHFKAFTKKHYTKIRERLQVSEKEFKAAVAIILSLTPKPGTAYSSSGKNHNFIIPDFFIYNNSGTLELTLNSKNAPQLHISEGYREMLKGFQANKKKERKDKEAVLFIKQKIDAAKWFIDAIKQRQHTLLLTMNAIMTYQKEFFLTGNDMTLRPMILKDIAEKIDMDISTISRVANSKYVQTEFGIFILKYFFSESLTKKDGKEVSTREVKGVMEEIIDNENKKRPYSDEKLMNMLQEKGYPVARRTVAKYREQMDIPVARLRKEA